MKTGSKHPISHITTGDAGRVARVSVRIPLELRRQIAKAAAAEGKALASSAATFLEKGVLHLENQLFRGFPEEEEAGAPATPGAPGTAGKAEGGSNPSPILPPGTGTGDFTGIPREAGVLHLDCQASPDRRSPKTGKKAKRHGGAACSPATPVNDRVPDGKEVPLLRTGTSAPSSNSRQKGVLHPESEGHPDKGFPRSHGSQCRVTRKGGG